MLSRTWRRVAVTTACAAAVPVLAALAGVAGLGALTAEGAGPVPGRVPVHGADGLWLGHAWVNPAGRGGRTEGDLHGLAARLRASGIRDVFVHVGPLAPDGSLDPALAPRARWLLAGLHREVPGLRVQAWLGQLAAPGAVKGRLNLDSAASRSRVLGAARQVLAGGFDGIAYDLEPVPSGNPGYLALLGATHALTRARHAVLSVAADQVEPLPGLAAAWQRAAGQAHWWTPGYLHAVAARADEVALMTYDTGMPTTAAYSGYVRVQARLALRAVPRRDTLLIGLPAYHDREPGHTGAETVAAVIRGVRLALGTRPPGRPAGVAMYADFSATPADWAAYFRDWSDPGAPAR